MYTRAYTDIVDYLLAFGVGRADPAQMSSNYIRAVSSVGFSSEWVEDTQVGDLVRLNAMRDPEYRLGWLMEKRELNPGYKEFLIQSAKTGNQCWWGNVGIEYFHRPTLANFPSWKWTDDQFAFSDLWDLACSEDDPYIYLPYVEEFQGDNVKVGMRTRFGLTEDREYVIISEWKKYLEKKRGHTRKALLGSYRHMVDQAKIKATKSRGATL